MHNPSKHARMQTPTSWLETVTGWRCKWLIAKGHSAFAKPRRSRRLSGAMIQEEITSNLRMTMVVSLCGEIPVWVQRSPSSGSEVIACIRPAFHWTQLEKLDKDYVKNLFKILECYTKAARTWEAKILGRREIKLRQHLVPLFFSGHLLIFKRPRAEAEKPSRKQLSRGTWSEPIFGWPRESQREGTRREVSWTFCLSKHLLIEKWGKPSRKQHQQVWELNRALNSFMMLEELILGVQGPPKKGKARYISLGPLKGSSYHESLK